VSRPTPTLISTDDRNVLEWRLDATSPDAIEEARKPGFTPVIVSGFGPPPVLSDILNTPCSTTISCIRTEQLTIRCVTKATLLR